MKYSFRIVSLILIFIPCCSPVSSLAQKGDAAYDASPSLSYFTHYSNEAHDTLIIDYEHSVLTMNRPDNKLFNEYHYVITNGRTKVETKDPIPLRNEFEIDLKEAIEASIFEAQDLHIDIFFEGQYLKKHISHDIRYLFSASAPIPIVSIYCDTIPTDRTRVQMKAYFYDVPNENGWYSTTGPYQESSGTIHARGQSSLDFPKKSFSMNFGKENPISLMGMPESHKWVMIGNWVDVTQLANKVSYDLYSEMGHYGAQSRHVQIYFNEEYWGLYTFGEKIQRGIDHVNTRNKRDGGFIVKEVDTTPEFITITGRTFDYEYPDLEGSTPEQRENIKRTIDIYEEKVMEKLDWTENLDESSEIDYFILTDAFANPDSYYNDKNLFYFLNMDSKLEPVIWDFIWAFGPPYFTAQGNNPWPNIYGGQNELMYGNPDYCRYVGCNRFFLMQWYIQDAQNVNMMKDRYRKWRYGAEGFEPILSDDQLIARIDELIAILESGNVYNQDRLRWNNYNNKYNLRFTPTEFRDKLLARLKIMDVKVLALQVQDD